MTEIAFHFNVGDKLTYTCRLVRKALGRGSKVVVTGEAGQLQALDTRLWSFSATDFLPHCNAANADALVLAASPVVLAEAPRAAPHHEVLVNLGGPVPEGFETFERLIELVTQDEHERLQGRRRWKHYADRGYAIRRFDLQGGEGP